MAFEVTVDKDVCISSGKCVADAPRAFKFDEEEIAEVTGEQHLVADAELLEIARNCPSGAIQLFDGGAEVSLD